MTSILSKYESEFIRHELTATHWSQAKSFTPQQFIWLGIENNEWSDGSTLDYTNFETMPVDKQKQKCAKMNVMNGKWSDESCLSPLTFSYVCKMPKFRENTTSNELYEDDIDENVPIVAGSKAQDHKDTRLLVVLSGASVCLGATLAFLCVLLVRLRSSNSIPHQTILNRNSIRIESESDNDYRHTNVKFTNDATQPILTFLEEAS